MCYYQNQLHDLENVIKSCTSVGCMREKDFLNVDEIK